MKNTDFEKAFGRIDDDLIVQADEPVRGGANKAAGIVARRRPGRAGIIAMAAAVGLVSVGGIGVLMGSMLNKAPENPSADGEITKVMTGISIETSPFGNAEGGYFPGENTDESYMYAHYKYKVDSGRFADYEMGRVIPDNKVGSMLETVSVTAGWMFRDSQGGWNWMANEHTDSEIFAIDGVSPETAVALKFKGELEAQLTTCYYVIINPKADPTPVKAYVIEPMADDSLLDGIE